MDISDAWRCAAERVAGDAWRADAATTLAMLQSIECVALTDLEHVEICRKISKPIGKLRKHDDKRVANAASTIVAQWKEQHAALALAARPPGRKRERVDYAEDRGGPALERSEETAAVATGEPSTVGAYRALLLAQKKEMCKDPPVLPPTASVLSTRAEPMRRRGADQGEGSPLSCADFPEFQPNLSPAEVIRRGSFGGTYFRPIDSAVTAVRYGAEVWTEYPTEWFAGLNVKTQVASAAYDVRVNRYKVKCGGSLGMWESSGWISSIDPYGWFQWYCRFSTGRRTTDDARQVARWLSGHGAKGRFRAQLANKVLAANTKFDDLKISPVIRQTCQHWGYVLTQRDLDTHKKRVKGR